MTKTLTEQWRDNDLADDKLYYWRISDGQELVQNKLGMCAYRLCNDSDKIEVLAPVPSYEKWKNMDDLLLIYKEENKRLKAVKEHCENVAGQYADKLVDTERNVERLEKRLAIATKALQEIAFEIGDLASDYGYHYELAEKALKEMEGVK